MRTYSLLVSLGLIFSLGAAAAGCGDDDDGGEAPGEPHLRGEWQSVWFDTVRGRPESEPLSIKVVNDGAGDTRTLGALLVGDTSAFRIVNDGCSGRALPPQGSCAIALALGAGQTGPFEGALRVWSIATPGQPGTTLELPLWGKMAPAELSVTAEEPTKDVGPGSTATFAITVKNEGGVPSGPIAVADAELPFALSGDCADRRLAGGETCQLVAAYAPPLGALLGSVSTRVSVEADPGGSADLSVLANVIVVPGLEAPDLDFGAVPTGQDVTKILTVRNPSTLTTQVSSAFFTDTSALGISRDACTGVSLAPGGTCELDVRLSSTYLIEPFEGTLSINADAVPGGVVRVFGTRYRAHFDLAILADFASTGTGTVSLDGSSASALPIFFVGPNGSTKTLHAAPDTGSVFLGWSGACGGTDDCVLTPADNADLQVMALFGQAI